MKRFASVLFALIVFTSCFAESKDSAQTITNQVTVIEKNNSCSDSVCTCKHCKCTNCICKTTCKKDTASTYTRIHRTFKNQTFYATLNESFSSMKDLTSGIEFGSWGTGDNPLTYGFVGAFNHNFDSKQHNFFVGGKVYYYFLEKDPYGMYVYMSPQFQTYNSDPTAKKFDFLFEYGIGGYYQPNKHFIISLGICAQTIYSQMTTAGGRAAIPAVGISFNYLR